MILQWKVHVSQDSVARFVDTPTAMFIIGVVYPTLLVVKKRLVNGEHAGLEHSARYA